MRFNKIIYSSTSKIFWGNLTIQITSVLQTIILARVLGPEGKGIFTQVILWPTIIAGFSILGLYTGIVKATARDNIFFKYNFSSSVLKVTTTTGILGFICSFALSYLLYPQNIFIRNLTQIFSIFIIANNIARGFVAIDHGRQNFSNYSLTRALLNPIFFLFLFLLYILAKATINNIVLAFLIANCIIAVIRVIIGIKNEKINAPNFSPAWLSKYSLKFAPSDFSEPIYAYYDKAIVAIVLSSYDLGIYTVAYSAAAMISIIPNVISTKIFSDIAGGGKIEIAIKQFRINLFLISLIGLLASSTFPIIIPLIVGEQYLNAIGPAILLIIACIFNGQSIILERVILARGFPFVGIKAKILTLTTFALLSFTTYFLGICSLYSIVFINIITGFLYMSFLIYKTKKIFVVRESFIPNISEIKQLIKNL